MKSTRRDWFAHCLAAAAWAEVAVRAATPPRFQTLDGATAVDIEAIAAQIIPSTDGPGAREAGVIYFIDRALSTFEADKRNAYRDGMSDLQQKRKQLFPNSPSIAALTAEQQMQLIRTIETSEFFELLRTHTVLGFLGNPSYGGNRDSAGWKYIGFEHRMAFQPPFGYYDAQAEGNRE
jgi:gluconate 2-dehydrogenase gamma chain